MKKFLISALLFFLICILFSFFFNDITVKIPIIGSIIAKGNLRVEKVVNPQGHAIKPVDLADESVIITLTESIKNDEVTEAKTIYYLDNIVIGEGLINEKHPIGITKLKFPKRGKYKLYYTRTFTYYYYLYGDQNNKIIENITKVNSEDFVATDGAKYEVEFIYDKMFFRRTNSSFFNDIYERMIQ